MTVPSHHIIELKTGEFLISIRDITLLNTIGDGIKQNHVCIMEQNSSYVAAISHSRGVWGSLQSKSEAI